MKGEGNSRKGLMMPPRRLVRGQEKNILGIRNASYRKSSTILAFRRFCVLLLLSERKKKRFIPCLLTVSMASIRAIKNGRESLKAYGTRSEFSHLCHLIWNSRTINHERRRKPSILRPQVCCEIVHIDRAKCVTHIKSNVAQCGSNNHKGRISGKMRYGSCACEICSSFSFHSRQVTPPGSGRARSQSHHS